MTFINENKDRIRVVVEVIANGYGGGIKYRFRDIMIKPYKKRKEISVMAGIRDRYDYRTLDAEGRMEYVKKVFLEYCTKEQLDQAIQEAYTTLAPTESNIEYSCR